MPIEVELDQFEELVADGLELLPDTLRRLIDNLVIVVEESHPEDLMGLYEGTPLTERSAYGFGEMPDTITIYRDGICGVCNDAEEVADEVAITVVHELAHHFGIDDDRLHELGWD